MKNLISWKSVVKELWSVVRFGIFAAFFLILLLFGVVYEVPEVPHYSVYVYQMQDTFVVSDRHGDIHWDSTMHPIRNQAYLLLSDGRFRPIGAQFSLHPENFSSRAVHTIIDSQFYWQDTFGMQKRPDFVFIGKVLDKVP